MQNLETGGSRNIQAESDGGFAFAKLPPGRYKVTAGGVTREVSVAIGTGTEVRLSDIASIEVSGSRTRNAIDVSSVESNTVFSQAEIQALPVSRNATAVALLAPGAVKGDAGLGDGGLASIGGASVAENGYYINGFDVTNIRNFLSYANLPFDAIEQQQIKTGGYGAEYGRSLGGVVSLSTKRGTNTWKSGVAVYWSPESLRSSGKNVVDLEPTHPNSYTVYAKGDKASSLSYNVYTGGPIIKDKLFIFGILEGQKNSFNNFGQDQSTKTESGRPNGLLKLDFLPNSDNRIEFTGISNKRLTKIYDYTNAKPYSTSNDGASSYSEQSGGGTVMMAKYTGYLTDNLTLSAQVGRVYEKNPKITGARVLGSDCPVVYSLTVTPLGCWVPPFPSTGTPDPKAPENSDTRKAGRLDLEYTLNAHTIRAGYDGQKFYSAEAGGSAYAGGVYYRYFLTSNGTVNGVANAVPAGAQYVRARVSQSTSGVYQVDNTAAYIEDSWKVDKDVLLYGGLRWESFNNKNGDGTSFVKADKLLAPRFGAAWNVNGDSSLKVYANAGRYYIPVASNTNIRATRGELSTTYYHSFTGLDPRTAAPLGMGPSIGIPQIVGDGSLPDPATIADTKLKPMSQDEFILGFQRALTKDLAFGMKYTHRSVNNGMDDFCATAPIAKWAKDNNYTKFDYHSLAQCVLMNPGNPLSLNIDLQNDGKYVPTTIPNSYLGLAKYERKYDAVEFSLDRPFDGKWGLSGSYTYSKSKGTAEGYVQSNLDQEDAGVTQDFDFGSFTDGANGYLPNDRRHAFKLFGNYGINENFRLGMNLTVASGRPTSCIGFVPPTVFDYYGPTAGSTSGGSGSYSSASSYYCLNDKGVPQLTQRGSVGRTPWTGSLDFSMAYLMKMGADKLTLQADIFNIFNSQQTTETNEVRDYSRGTSITPPGQLNMNYGQPTSFQGPRSVRLTARYEF